MLQLRVRNRTRSTLPELWTYLLAGLVISWCSTAYAAALALYETGAPDLGTASAGRAAMGVDASTAGSNPAGLTLLDRSQLMLASGALLPLGNFDRGSQTSVPNGGSGGGNVGVFMPIGGAFYAYRLSDRLWFGFAAGSTFGLAADFGKHWVGRYYVTRTSILTGGFNPSIAYRVNEWLSVGAGFSFNIARLYDQAKVNNALPRVPDGGLEIESWDEAFGGNVGFLLRPIEKLKIGLTYQSPIDYKFGFHPHTTGLGPGLQLALKRTGLLGSKVNLTMTEPQQMMASAIYQLTPALVLLGNIGWQNWSQFGQTTLGISGLQQKTLAVDLQFSDTIQIAFGAQYHLSDKWLWSGGFAYDSAPVSAQNRVPTLAFDRQLRYGTGVQYQVSRDLNVGLAYELVDCGNAPFDVRKGPLAGTLQGDYSANYLNFLGVNAAYKF